MKIVFLTGNHQRHAFMARRLAETGALAGLVVEHREEMLPPPPDDIPERTKKLFIEHFRRRAAAEQRFFGAADFPQGCSRVDVEPSDISGRAVRDFAAGIGADLLLSYGVHKFSDDFLTSVGGEKWNIHGGLSPWYRGVITHFWPSYMLEPQMTGMTLHETTSAIDGGDVVHQAVGPMVRGDGVHDLACRTVEALGNDFTGLIASVVAQGGPAAVQKHRHTTTGRIWRSVDWHPCHLHLVYDYYEDAIVDRYLDGTLNRAEPRLHCQPIVD